MLNIPIYIAYLLTRHECVIVPELGAFVVSADTNAFMQKDYLYLPTQLIGFNSDILHNDGLLANSIAEIENIAYAKVCYCISQYVEDVRMQLGEGEEVFLPWIGKLQLTTNGKIVFSPSAQISCNAKSFGFNEFVVPALSELTDSFGRERELYEEGGSQYVLFDKKRHALVRLTSVAAALLAMFTLSTPVNDQLSSALTNRTQQASFLSFSRDNVSFNKNITPAVPFLTEISPIDAEEKITIQGDDLPKKFDRHYYIIISSLPSYEVALKKVEEYAKTGKFPDAGVISSSERNRVFVKQFQNKQDAEIFLNEFRNDYPEHAKAWLLSQ